MSKERGADTTMLAQLAFLLRRLYSIAARCVATNVMTVVLCSAAAESASSWSSLGEPAPEYVTLRATAPLLPMSAIPNAHSANWMWWMASGLRAKSIMAVIPTLRDPTSLYG